MELKTKSIPLSNMVAEQDDNYLRISGYGSVFGVVDLDNEIIEKDSWCDFEPSYVMLWGHRHDQVLGRWDVVKSDDTGIYLEGRILTTTQIGHDVAELVREGIVDGLSVSMSVKSTNRDTTRNATILQDCRLHEISVVALPCNVLARIETAKDSGDSGNTTRLAEHLLRQAGCSQKQALTLISKLRDELKMKNDLRRLLEAIRPSDSVGKTSGTYSVEHITEKEVTL